MGFFDEMGSSMQEGKVQKQMNSVGAYKGSHSENCERCNYYVDTPNSGSKYYGGCSYHQINVFASYVCNNYIRG